MTAKEKDEKVKKIKAEVYICIFKIVNKEENTPAKVISSEIFLSKNVISKLHAL